MYSWRTNIYCMDCQGTSSWCRYSYPLCSLAWSVLACQVCRVMPHQRHRALHRPINITCWRSVIFMPWEGRGKRHVDVEKRGSRGYISYSNGVNNPNFSWSKILLDKCYCCSRKNWKEFGGRSRRVAQYVNSAENTYEIENVDSGRIHLQLNKKYLTVGMLW